MACFDNAWFCFLRARWLWAASRPMNCGRWIRWETEALKEFFRRMSSSHTFSRCVFLYLLVRMQWNPFCVHVSALLLDCSHTETSCFWVCVTTYWVNILFFVCWRTRIYVRIAFMHVYIYAYIYIYIYIWHSCMCICIRVYNTYIYIYIHGIHACVYVFVYSIYIYIYI